jgi:DNA-directed RNA polymerase specialized sigma24 family protein
MSVTDGKRDDGPSAPAHGGEEVDFAGEIESSYRKLLVVAAASWGQPQLAEDILQEAALTALRKLDQFEPGTNFVA